MDIQTESIFRDARPEDSARAALLIHAASGGVLDFLYAANSPYRSATTLLEESLKNDFYPFSYRCTRVVEVDGEIIGASMGYPGLFHGINEFMKSFFPREKLAYLEDYYAVDLENCWFIHSLSILPAYQRRGLASKLLNMEMEKAKVQGFKEITLAVFSNNHAARQLYNKRGFKQITEIQFDSNEYIHDSLCYFLRANGQP